MIKLFVSDLDGTLLLRDEVRGSYLPDFNLQAIHRLDEAGIRFAIASGRHQIFLEMLLKQIALPCDVIADNGAMVVIDGQPHLISLDREHCRLMATDYLSQPFAASMPLEAALVDGGCVRSAADPRPRTAPRRPGFYYRYDLETYFSDPTLPAAVKLINFVPKGGDIESWTWKMRDLYADYFDIYSSGFDAIEFMSPGIDKGYGLRMVMAQHGLSSDEVAVIGDADNDISMMLQSNNAFAMATGDPHIRKYCRYSAKTVAQAIDDVIAANRQGR